MTREMPRAAGAFLLALAAAFASAAALAQQARPGADIETAFAALKPQRPGVVDAYVLVAALDDDPVFGREAREAGRVLAARFDAADRTLVLAADEGADKADAPASPQTLALAFTRIAQAMDRNEDVLVFYSTSHGVPDGGLVYKSKQLGSIVITPTGLAGSLSSLGIKNRLLILQACFAGQFVPALKGPTTIVVTAAASDRSSFGCQAGNDWTYFGDALINHAFRQPLPLDVQFRRAFALISAAEDRDGLTPSNPQFNIGSDTGRWLAALDQREPATAAVPVGQTVLGLGR